MRATRPTAIVVLLLPIAAAANELVCFGKASDVTQASVTCFAAEDVRHLRDAFRFVRLFYSDNRAALKKDDGLLVDCAGRKVYAVDRGRIEDATYGELAGAVCKVERKR